MYRSLCTASAFALLALAGPALAQDEKPFWSGWYAGINAGGSWGNTDHRFLVNGATIPPADVNNIILQGHNGGNPGGFTVGGEAGYNWMHKYGDGDFLYGLETDFDYLDMKATRTGTFTSAVSINPPPATTPMVTVGQGTKADWLWTVRPRIGYATGPWLFYATGGLALADIKLTTNYSDTFGHAGSASTSSTRAGWTVGGGIGYALSANWSIKAEYLYADFGNVSQSAVISGGYGTLTSENSPRTNIARVGIDYRF
jgi:outer membrane immunogenic protein